MNIEVIGKYQIVLEAFPTLSEREWTPYLTIYRGYAGSPRSNCIFPRQAILGTTPFQRQEQAIEAARLYAARKIAFQK